MPGGARRVVCWHPKSTIIPWKQNRAGHEKHHNSHPPRAIHRGVRVAHPAATNNGPDKWELFPRRWRR